MAQMIHMYTEGFAFEADHVAADLSDPNLDLVADRDWLLCVAYEHCEQTDTMDDRCDYVTRHVRATLGTAPLHFMQPAHFPHKVSLI